MWPFQEGEQFTVANTAQVFPGLYVVEMAANNAFGGPRKGPVFGACCFRAKRWLKFWLKNEMVSPVHSLPKTHKLNLMIWTAVNSVCPYRSTEVRVPIPLPVVKQHIFAGLDLN